MLRQKSCCPLISFPDTLFKTRQQLIGIKAPYFGYNHKRHEGCRDDQVDPEKPTEEDEVRGHRGSEVGLYLHDANLPWYEPGLQIDQLSPEILPFLKVRMPSHIIVLVADYPHAANKKCLPLHGGHLSHEERNA